VLRSTCGREYPVRPTLRASRGRTGYANQQDAFWLTSDQLSEPFLHDSLRSTRNGENTNTGDFSWHVKQKHTGRRTASAWQRLAEAPARCASTRRARSRRRPRSRPRRASVARLQASTASTESRGEKSLRLFFALSTDATARKANPKQTSLREARNRKPTTRRG